jgi:hypothetical protein
MSGEHLASRCIFDTKSVIVEGFSWCKEKPKEISVETLVANVLCRDHNAELSPADTAAGQTFTTFEEAVRLFGLRRSLAPSKLWATKRFDVDGVLLERWMLKTFINFSFRGNNLIGLDATEPGKCPDELAQIAFGRQPFHGHSGLYVAVESSKVIEPPEGKVFSLATMLLGDRRLVAGLFKVSGISLMLWLPSDRSPAEISGSTRVPEWSQLTFVRHPAKFNFNLSERKASRSHTIYFAWV